MIINAFRRVAGGRQPTTQISRSIRSYTTEQPLAGEARIRQKLTESFKPIRLQVEDVSGTYILKYRYYLITFLQVDAALSTPSISLRTPSKVLLLSNNIV